MGFVLSVFISNQSGIPQTIQSRHFTNIIFSSIIAKLDIDPHKSAVEDLEKHDVVVFISDDKEGIGQRMKFIADSKKFCTSRFEHSLNLWEPDEDVSLYLFRQPIDNWSRFLERAPKVMENMLKSLNELPKTYFVLYFSVNEWQKYQSQLMKYDFFEIAKKTYT